MTEVSMQVIIPQRFLRDPARFQHAIDTALDGAALSVKADFNVTVRTWDDKPQFEIRKSPGERFIGTGHRIYKFISGGTSVRYAIMSKNFRPKSRVGFIGSNQGSGGMVFISKKHPRPGIKARKFEVVIKQKWDKELPKIMQRSIDSELK